MKVNYVIFFNTLLLKKSAVTIAPTVALETPELWFFTAVILASSITDEPAVIAVTEYTVRI